MSEQSPLLDWPGAVEAAWPDEGVAWHYGEPMREQRAAEESAAVVDRSTRGVLRITGADRLPWLHSLTTQQLEKLADGTKSLLGELANRYYVTITVPRKNIGSRPVRVRVNRPSLAVFARGSFFDL